MTVDVNFKRFCNNIKIDKTNVQSIRWRTERITSVLNESFWDSKSEINHRFYGGSYGRDTDISGSDIDLLFEIPSALYYRYNAYTSNGQSSLLQAVRASLKRDFIVEEPRADGQIVKLEFYDDKVTCFEVVPCFIFIDGKFKYTDANNGGSWKITDPRREIKAIEMANNECNKNLKNLCRMTRSWRKKWNVPISGLLIDTLSYNFLTKWEHRKESFFWYDFMVRDFFKYLMSEDINKNYYLAPGSGQYVYNKGNFQFKAKRCYELSVQAIKEEENEFRTLSIWKEIFGDEFSK